MREKIEDWMEGPIGKLVLKAANKIVILGIVVFLVLQVVNPGRIKDKIKFYVMSPDSAAGAIIYGMVDNPYTFLELSVLAEREGNFIAARRFIAYGIFLLTSQKADPVQLRGFRRRLQFLEGMITPRHAGFEGDMLLEPREQAVCPLPPPEKSDKKKPRVRG